ncbi:tetratricopeptide repeat protein [Streptomyces sp. NPDC098789]|uniref:tetratricopeptide repeat protein n=1 Tax=Streptomyces sp. NPDC098789 TaxID=3366098 RepID=UPI0037F6C84E
MLLGIHPGPDFDPPTAAALLGVEPRDAERILEDLLDSQLLLQHEAGRYAFHDLVRSFALSLWEESARNQKDTAVGKLLHYYLGVTNEACSMLFPGLRPTGYPPSAGAPGLPSFPDARAARRWYDLLLQGIELHRELDSVRRESIALYNISSLHLWQGRSTEAILAAERAATLCRDVGEQEHERAALNDLAIAHLDRGEGTAAQKWLDRALALGENSAMPRNRAMSLALRAVLCQRRGRGEEATAHIGQALALVRPLGTATWQCEVENIAGLVHRHAGDYANVLRLHRSAYQRALNIGYRIGMAHGLHGLVSAETALGLQEPARENGLSAEELFATMDIPRVILE